MVDVRTRERIISEEGRVAVIPCFMVNANEMKSK